MRRWTAAVALGGALALGLTGCGLPEGVDGELTNSWQSIPEPSPFVPPAEVCHPGDFAETAYLSSYSPVDCATPHRVETVHVGTFAAATAEATEPPTQDSAEIRAAYAECDTRTTEYVGADWRLGRLWVGVAVPSPAAWDGGARWFRCDVTEVTNVEDNGGTASRTASLRDALAEPSPLHLTCYAVRNDSNGAIDTMPAEACDKPHNAEFAGVWQAPDIPYPTQDRDWQQFHTECRKVIGRYAGVPLDDNLQFRTGVISLPGGAAEWAAGNRGVRCYLWLNERNVTRSLKGAGTEGLPIQYE